MNIAWIGATGFVPSAILEEELQRGHEVTAIVRHPERLTSYQKLRRHKGDVYKEDGVARLVASHDTIVSAVNPGWGQPRPPQFKDTRAIITAVNKAGDCTIAVGQQDRQFGRSTGV
ncbi:MAG TPA: NAD(P)H-binding protein [Nitrospiraceae bacterium]|nr:NAD(P)H-binding protein [Nitrospiraceae bacterium]